MYLLCKFYKNQAVETFAYSFCKLQLTKYGYCLFLKSSPRCGMSNDCVKAPYSSPGSLYARLTSGLVNTYVQGLCEWMTERRVGWIVERQPLLKPTKDRMILVRSRPEVTRHRGRMHLKIYEYMNDISCQFFLAQCGSQDRTHYSNNILRHCSFLLLMMRCLIFFFDMTLITARFQR